ncbi:MAG: hypothetical protein N3D84_02855 [Candidatus Woesearchaeota archaeon]|nr:hypothetical protein [Candidatus Woesearchaeota archaeon]
MAGKKASLELSINAIVIIVLAFVLLGLGLGFIRGQFKQITGTTGQVQEQVKQQILEDLRTGDKKLSFPTQRVQIDKKSTMDLAIGIKNTKPAGDLKFYLDIFTSQDKNNGISCKKKTTEPTEFDQIEADCGDNEPIEDLKFFFDKGPYTLGVAEAEVYPISVESPSNSNTYMVSIIVWQCSGPECDKVEPTPYAEKSFFVQVT